MTFLLGKADTATVAQVTAVPTAAVILLSKTRQRSCLSFWIAVYVVVGGPLEICHASKLLFPSSVRSPRWIIDSLVQSLQLTRDVGACFPSCRKRAVFLSVLSLLF